MARHQRQAFPAAQRVAAARRGKAIQAGLDQLQQLLSRRQPVTQARQRKAKLRHRGGRRVFR